MYMWVDIWELLSLLVVVALVSFCLGGACFLYLSEKRKKGKK